MYIGVEGAMARAREAQTRIASWPQRRVDDLVAAVGWWCYREDNVTHHGGHGAPRHRVGRSGSTCSRCTASGCSAPCGTCTAPRPSACWKNTPDLGVRTLAKPIGVVALISPATAPCSAVVLHHAAVAEDPQRRRVQPEPGGAGRGRLAIGLIRAALEEVDAPPDLVQLVGPSERVDGRGDDVAPPTSWSPLGGASTVRRAYTSGTPAIGAGVGNPTVIVDETADLAMAAEKIAMGSSYNNGTSCSSESNLLVAREIAGEFETQLAGAGVHLCTMAETDRLRRALWPDGVHLDRAAIGRPAAVLAARADIDLMVPDKTTALVAMLGGIDVTDPLFGEKLSPVLTLVTYGDFAEAVAGVDTITRHCGAGHSCGIHTARADRVTLLAERIGVARVMVNQSTASGNSGNFDNGLPFTSIVASGSWGGCAQSENVTWRHFMNRTTISRPIPERKPSEEAVFGVHWDRHGV